MLISLFPALTNRKENWFPYYLLQPLGKITTFGLKSLSKNSVCLYRKEFERKSQKQKGRGNLVSPLDWGAMSNEISKLESSYRVPNVCQRGEALREIFLKLPEAAVSERQMIETISESLGALKRC